MVLTNKRRRFQAPITSYLTAPTPSSNPSQATRQEAPHHRPEPISTPTLPGAIQSSLLTVGMRIRKSVPEGYKTHKTLNETACPGQSRQAFDSSLHTHYLSSNPTYSSTYSSGGYAELAPFCGLHKVGGMAVQPMPAAASILFSTNGKAGDDDLPPWTPPTSQESVDSTTPLPLSNKRQLPFDLDEDDDDDEILQRSPDSQIFHQHISYHPSPYPFNPDLNNHFLSPIANPQIFSSTSTSGGGTPGRSFATPRSRRLVDQHHHYQAAKKAWTPVPEGQENIGSCGGAKEFVARSSNGHEFEEAGFLQAREDVDVDEMMMG